MMRLSQYVPDPLNMSSDIWWHPITQAKVRLSPALRAKLPGILRADLDQEGRHPEDILNQFIAAELRDLGFLIPSQWIGTEERFFALQSRPSLGVPGLLGLAPKGLPHPKSKIVLMTVGSAQPMATGRPSSLMELRQASHSQSREKAVLPIEPQGQPYQDFFCDLGHLATEDLTPDQVALKIRQWLPVTGEERLPVILMDQPSSLPDLIHDPDFWPQKNNASPVPFKTIIADTTLRCGSGLPRDAERLRPVSESNLFAQLEWRRCPSTPPLAYLMPSGLISLLENHSDTRVFTQHHPACGHHEISESSPSRDTLWILHGALFSRHLHLPLRREVERQLLTCHGAHALKGLVIWGLDAVPQGALDHEALNATLLSLKEQHP